MATWLPWPLGSRGTQEARGVSAPGWWQRTSPACRQLPALEEPSLGLDAHQTWDLPLCPWQVGGGTHGWPLSHACRCHCPPAIPGRAGTGWRGAGSCWRGAEVCCAHLVVPRMWQPGEGEAAPRGHQWGWASHEVRSPPASPPGEVGGEALRMPSMSHRARLCLLRGLSLACGSRGSCPPRPHRSAGAGMGGPALPVPLPRQPVMGRVGGLAGGGLGKNLSRKCKSK